ncbi:MAG TPA: hypothetical protein VHC90_00550 [Bryobacteraceae bacterium]|nr:hypothetical protein [Bryobacteraceae bacterium]
MRRLTQRKETANRKTRTRRQKNLPAAVAVETPLIPAEMTAEPAADTIAAVVHEEPLPLMVAEMALWGAAMSALVIPIGMATMIASPFAIARDMWRSRGPAVTAQPVAVAA